MKRRGIAIGSFRLDSRKWDASEKMNKPTAATARGRMINRGLTDSIVRDVIGGSMAAEKQSRAYQGIIDNIKNNTDCKYLCTYVIKIARNFTFRFYKCIINV